MVTMICMMMLFVADPNYYLESNLMSGPAIEISNDKGSDATLPEWVKARLNHLYDVGPAIPMPDVAIAGFEFVTEVNEVSETDNSRDDIDWGAYTVPCSAINESTCITSDWYDSMIKKHISATERYVTTTRVRITTLTFDWLGQKRTVEDRKALWTKTRKFVKREEWAEEK